MSHLLHNPLQLARKLFEEDPPATVDAAIAMILTDRARTCEVLTSALREYRDGDIGDMLDLLKELRDKYVSGSMQEPLGVVQEERDALADEVLKLQNYMLEQHPEEEAQPGSLVDAAIRVLRRQPRS